MTSAALILIFVIVRRIKKRQKMLVDSADHIQTKVRELMEKNRELQIPELEGKRLSVSMGVSYAPDHGKTYLELYHHADEALYETKRNGKNGYKVYTLNRESAETE